MKLASYATLVILGGLLSTWSASQAQQNLVINEFMAENDNFWADPTDNKFDDWIEIYNSSFYAVNLKGYFLTDNPSLPIKWFFPDVTIQTQI